MRVSQPVQSSRRRSSSGGGGGTGPHGLMTLPNFDATALAHTLPAAFAGLGFDDLSGGLFVNSTYQAVMQTLGIEIMRMNFNTSVGQADQASAYSVFYNFRDLALALNASVIMGPVSAAPNALPSTLNANNTNNVHADGSLGASPNDHVGWFLHLKAHGVKVLGYEFCNEPDLQNVSSPSKGTAPWYSSAADCTTWAAVNVRKYGEPIKAAADANGYPRPLINGPAESDAAPYGWSRMKNYMSGACDNGQAWLWGDSNWNYWDVMTFHPYNRGNTDQGRMNCIFYDPGNNPGSDASTGVYWFGRMFHDYIVAQGHPTKQMAYNESGVYGSRPADAFSALYDIGQAIYSCGIGAGMHNLAYFTPWSGNVSADTSDYPIMNTSFVLYTRACILRDLLFYFVKNYKQVIAYGQAGGNTPSSGEFYGNNNSIPRLPWVAARNAAGNKLAILVCNLDLTNQDSLLMQWQNKLSTGTITDKYAQQSTSITGSTSVPQQNVGGSGLSSLTRTIGAGEMHLYEIPI